MALSLAGTGAAAAAPAPVGQRLAVVNHAAVVHSAPDRASARESVVRPTRPLTGGPTVLPVTGRARDASGESWLRVLLPGRPNGRSGWIRGRSTSPAGTGWRIEIRLATRQVTVVRNGRRARSFRAVVGAPVTPTPVGTFFVEEVVVLGRREAGAPYALALSARSDVLQEFAGGPGQIALHGMANVGGVLGTAASHGCVRMTTAAVTWIARHVGPGTPVTITR